MERSYTHETTKLRNYETAKRNLHTRWARRHDRISFMFSDDDFMVRPVGVVRSELTDRRAAPRPGSEGAPDAWLGVEPWAADALLGIAVGDELIVMTWFHRAHRDVLQVHPRGDRRNALAGVFATRSPDRPNPIGLHPVVVRAIDGVRVRIGPIEAIDGTPVVDIKIALC